MGSSIQARPLGSSMIQGKRVIRPSPPGRGTPTEPPPSVQHAKGSVRVGRLALGGREIGQLNKGEWELSNSVHARCSLSMTIFEKGCSWWNQKGGYYDMTSVHHEDVTSGKWCDIIQYLMMRTLFPQFKFRIVVIPRGKRTNSNIVRVIKYRNNIQYIWETGRW